MKKVFAIILVCIFMLGNATIVSADPISEPNLHVYETSGGYSYNLDDFDIYIEDFDDTTFDSAQDLIDYFYEIGMQRLNNLIEDYNTWTKLTLSEKLLLISHFIYANGAKEAYTKANNYTGYYYGAQAVDTDNDKCNAFKHACWTMLLCQKTSPAFALDFTTAHEDREDNNELSMGMDLTNNRTSYDYFTTYLTNNTYTDDELAQLVKNKIDNGDYIYLFTNYRYLKKIVYPFNGEPHYYYEYGSFYAYTNSDEPYNVPDPEIVYLPQLPLDPWDQVLRPNDIEENEDT